MESVCNQSIKPNEVVLVVEGNLSDKLNHMTVCMKKDSVLKVGNYSEQKMI